MKYIIIVNELYREYYGVDTPIRLSLLHTKLKSSQHAIYHRQKSFFHTNTTQCDNNICV